MNKTTTIQKDMGLLRIAGLTLCDRDLLDFYKFASRTPLKKRLWYTSARNLLVSDGFHSTVGMSPSSADAVLLVVTRAMARFTWMHELQRRTSRWGLPIDTGILIAENDLRNMDTAQKPGADIDSLQHITSCRNPQFDLFEDMEALSVPILRWLISRLRHPTATVQISW